MERNKSFKYYLPFAVLALFSAAVSCFFDIFVLHYSDPSYIICSALIAVLLFLMPLSVLVCRGETKKKAALKALIAMVVGTAAMFGLTFYFDNINDLGSEKSSSIGIAAAAIVLFVPLILHFATLKKQGKAVKAVSAAISLVCICAMAFSYAQIILIPAYKDDKMKNYDKMLAEPTGCNHADGFDYEGVKSADLYVSTNGSDENDGSLDKPFKTVERAREAVRSLDKTGKSQVVVGIMAGDYRVSALTFTAEDSGTKDCPIRYCKYGEGEVVFNSGVAVRPEDFKAVTDESALARLNDGAKEKVLCLDLSEYGITAEDYGKIYAIGDYTTAAKYDGDWTGDIYSEVFFNDTRMTLARYPDTGDDYLYTEEVVSTGDGLETNGSTTKVSDWENRRNHPGDVYRINEALANRINSWKTLDDVWVFGWWKYDWADASSPIGEFGFENRTLSPKFVSMYGTKVGAPYYFYNVFEELSAPGEFYLDRETGVLYIYPTADMAAASIDISLATHSTVILDNASFISFEGLTFKNTRGDAVTVKGNGNRITRCLIKNVAGNAINSNGYDNVYDCNEITRTGMGGIILDGGDRETLTPGNNRAENNLIHDWSEIYQTYKPAVSLYGVGNICAHNEMYNSPHEAITWGGNNHIIEYNVIHDVCLLTNDGAAIYSGRSWNCYGNVIRYNCIYNLGSTVKNGSETVRYTPDGIYLDDALSGQKVYGNILINIPKFSLHLGGGRDNDVRNNLIINPMEYAVHFDDRAREGVINNGWFKHSSEKDGDMWINLFESPWKTEVWQKAYPQMTRFSDDFSNTDSPDFVPNPAYCDVTGNVIVSSFKEYADASESVYKFSKLENNPVFKIKDIDRLFVDPENGNYNLREDSEIYSLLPDYEAVSVENSGIVY